ncbi:MAG: Ig-like domain-containing protein [Clostridiales bacterium]|jgi:hypothetical protein|nr:Ig-like domain-containing protein [Clostridiales bacterium]
MKKNIKILVTAIVAVAAMLSLASCSFIDGLFNKAPKGDFTVTSDKTELTFAGDSLTLTAKKGDTVVYDVEWTSGNAAVASVSNGVVVALSSGTTAITAVRGEDSAEFEVGVSILEGALTLSASVLNFDSWDSAQALTASVDGTVVTDEVVWTTSDDSVAQVINGVVISRADNAKGSLMGGGEVVPVVITAAYKGQTASAQVFVEGNFKVAISGDDLVGGVLAFDGAGGASVLGAVVTLGSAGDVETGYVWESTDERVAAVDENGTVTAVKNGVAKIRAVSKLQKNVLVLEGTNYVRRVASAAAEITVKVGAESADMTAIAGVYKGEYLWQGFYNNSTDKIAANRGWIVADVALTINADGTFVQDMHNAPRATWIAEVDENLPETTKAEKDAKYGTRADAYFPLLTDGAALTAERNDGKTYIDLPAFAMGNLGGVIGTLAIYGDQLYITVIGTYSSSGKPGAANSKGAVVNLGSVNPEAGDYWLNNQYSVFSGMTALSPEFKVNLAKVVEASE